MHAEQSDIYKFLRKTPPFNVLPKEAVEHAALNIEISYVRAGTDILAYGEPIHDLYIVRSGSVEVFRRSGELYNRLDDRGLFGQFGLLMHNRVRFPVTALEDTLLYCLPENVFNEFFEQYQAFSDFMEVEDSGRLHNAVQRSLQANPLNSVRLSTIILQQTPEIDEQTSAQDAARLMLETMSSSLLVVRPGPEDSAGKRHCVGIVTQKDISNRIVAVGEPLQTNVQHIMTRDLVSLDQNAYVYEAVMAMLRNNTRHILVQKGKRPVSIIDMNDIVRYESNSSLLLMSSIFRQQTVEDLQKLSSQVEDCFVRLVEEDANSHMIGSAMAVIGRSFKQRLLELAEEKLGPPPVPYCFLALGSMARDEQLVVTDQDNGLLLDNSYVPEEHGFYFNQLASFVSDGLAACGYRYCDGGIMATNSDWQKTRQQWQTCFAEWIEEPDPKALLHSSIFFDLEGVWGRKRWAEELSEFVVSTACKNPRFLACLARNALNRTPPLGFFKNFVMEKDGRHNKSINLKRRGTAPMSDLIRVHALAVESSALNSFERLDDIIAAGILTDGMGQNLKDAMEFISMVRIRHQAKSITAGIAPDNNVDPDRLSNFERRNLKDAFNILSNAQNFLKFRYQNISSI